MPPAVGQFSQDAGGRALVERPFGFVHNGGGGTSDACDVLQKEVSRTASVGNIEDVEEEAASFAIKPGPSPRKGQVLAREARNDAIHCSSPGCSVEGENVGPDRCCIQRSFFHARCQDCGWVCFPFKVAADASVDAHSGEPGA
jgi:hypothetical protein